MKVVSCPYKDCGRVFNTEKKLKEHEKAIHYDEKLNIDDM